MTWSRAMRRRRPPSCPRTRPPKCPRSAARRVWASCTRRTSFATPWATSLSPSSGRRRHVLRCSLPSPPLPCPRKPQLTRVAAAASPCAQRELTALFRRITSKLDALSNFHYTPKAHIPEMSVKPSVPAIAMEEVLPLTVAGSATAVRAGVHTHTRPRAPSAQPAQPAQPALRRRPPLAGRPRRR